MADYSNRGFFTPAHNLGEGTYNLPSNDPGTYTQDIVETVNGQKSRYLDGTVPDAIGGTSPMIHLTRQIIFYDGAVKLGVPPPSGAVYSLDRGVYDNYADLLLGRAVAYSAGLLNYYFRGSMQVSLPDAGFYSIVDHAQFAPGQPDTPTDDINGFHGFNKLKLKLVNTTPDISPPLGAPAVPQDMPNGTVVAVLKFHRNTCYDDLLVDWPANGTAALPCRSPNEEIVVSDPLTSQAVPFSTPTAPNGIELTFTFAEKELPINAWDVTLQVVYRGRLGSEPDAVVAVTQDISEPTFTTFMNFTDYVLLDGTFYTPADLAANHQDLFANVTPGCRSGAPGSYSVNPLCYNFVEDLSFTAGSNPVTIAAAGPTAIAPRHIARFAMLTDLNAWPSLNWQPGSVTCWQLLSDPLQLKPYVAQGIANGQFSYSDPSTLRGVTSWDGEICYTDIGVNQTLSGTEDRSTLTDPLQNPSEITPTPLTITGW